MQDDWSLLKAMMQDMQKQCGLYKPSIYWRKYSKRIEKEIKKNGIADFRSNPRIGKGYADVFIDDLSFYFNGLLPELIYNFIKKLPITRRFVSRVNRFIFNKNVQVHHYKRLYYSALLSEWFEKFTFNKRLPDSLIANPHRTIPFFSQEIGEKYLYNYSLISDVSKHVDFSRLHSVLEIGGGFGSMAHIILSLYPNIKKYCIVDIPPILYVSTQYLKHIFGDDIVIDYCEAKNRKIIEFTKSNDKELLLLSPWQMEYLDCKFDFFWNSSSFQEMTKPIVSNYAMFLKKFLTQHSQIGLFAYANGDEKTTISIHELINVLSSGINADLKEIDSEVINNLQPGSIYIGSLK